MCGKQLSNLIIGHWTVPQPQKSEAQLAAEHYLLTIPKSKTTYLTSKLLLFNRWYLFIAAFLTQFCCGSLYAWSVFNGPIDSLLYNGDTKAGKAVITFYVAVGVFGLTTATFGPWLERHGPRLGLMLGTSMFLVGHVITAIALSQKSLVGVIIGYGVFTGFGLGLNYISPVSALQKWFPDCRGTAAGFAVGGFGAGSVVWGKVYLPSRDAFSLEGSFLFLGGLMAVIMYGCAMVMRTPPPDFTVGGMDIHGAVVNEDDKEQQHQQPERMMVDYVSSNTPREKSVGGKSEQLEKGEEVTTISKLSLIDSIVSTDYMFLYIVFFGNSVFGLVVLSRLSNMATNLFDQPASEGANVVAINGVFNCCGRLVLPMISDFLLIRTFKLTPAFARKIMFFLMLLLQVVIVSTLPAVIRAQNYDIFRLEVWTLTVTYGGGFGTIPCFLTDMFGAYNIGAMHGIILTAWSIGGVGGGLGFTSNYDSLIKNHSYSIAEAYIANFEWILIVIILGFVALVCVRTNEEDRFAVGVRYQYSIFGKPIIKVREKSN